MSFEVYTTVTYAADLRLVYKSITLDATPTVLNASSCATTANDSVATSLVLTARICLASNDLNVPSKSSDARNRVASLGLIQSVGTSLGVSVL
jgi:hypothetical protein